MRYQRLEALIGKEQVTFLRHKSVLIFGLGGVGSFAVEALARSGIGKLILVDPDQIEMTNINRQLLALTSTMGRMKTEVMADRIREIDPTTEVITYPIKLTPDTVGQFLLLDPDWIVDAIDDIPAKLCLIEACMIRKSRFISSMGFANKIQPECVQIAQMHDTKMCPMSKSVRHELNKRHISLDFPVVYSSEKPSLSMDSQVRLASTAFVPSVAGLMMASVVIRSLIGWEDQT